MIKKRSNTTHASQYSLQDWLSHILAEHVNCHQLGLDRLKPIVEKLELTTFSCPVISVVGTNGKGSCVKLLENIYRAAGYQVGDYTSPHLLKFNERICLNGKSVSNHEMIEAFEVIEKEKAETALTFFEFVTLAALYIFKQHHLDILILEVGLGGRLDPLNLIDADLVLLTTIGLDHMKYLGPDRESIAKEKAALFRKNRFAVCGEIDPPKSVLETAAQIQTDLYLIHRDFEYAFSNKDWHWQREKGEMMEYHKLPLPKVKLQNAAMVLMTLTLLQKKLPVQQGAIIKGLEKTKLSGRFEKVKYPVSITNEFLENSTDKLKHFGLGKRHISCILDVAHNVQAVQWLIEQLEKIKTPGKLLGVFSMLKEKDIEGVARLLKPFVHEWYLGALDNHRALPTKEIAHILRHLGVKKIHIFDTVEESFKMAEKNCGLKDSILVFGSFYLVSTIKKMKQHKE